MNFRLPPRGWGYRGVPRGHASSSRRVEDLPTPPRGPGAGSMARSEGQPREGRDYRRPLALDFSLIAEAQAYYASEGFVNTPVPWVVGSEAYEETKPADVAAYRTLGGFLVASAEQAFLHLMLEGQELGRAQATTPCFRDEAHDEIHAPYFLKTELIVGDEASERALGEVVEVARGFFSLYLPTRVQPFEDGTFDLVCYTTGLELGSYGIRRHRGLAWVYGTGVALPRLTQAIAMLEEPHE